MMLRLLFLLTAACLCQAELTPKSRNPKLFWVSTESSTSTVVTSSFCYQTAGTLTACKKKRRRRFLEEDIQIDHDIKPDSPYYSEIEEDDPEELTSGFDPLKMSGEMRDGRLLLYWMTTTSVITTSSFTSVLTLASITCTPNSFVMDFCGSVGKK